MYISTGTLTELLEADLTAAGWDGAKAPYPGQSLHQFTLMSLSKSLLKKYLPGTPIVGGSQGAKALDLFLSINERCRSYSYQDQLRSEAEEICLGEAKAFLYDFFYPAPSVRMEPVGPNAEMQEVCYYRDFILRPSALIEGTGCGPGAAVGSLSTDFYTKLFTSNLTATSQTLYEQYVQTISYHPTWRESENNRARVRGVKIVSGSRLSFVPKTAEICRTICSEPILNMFFQKGVQHVLERRLREVVGIDLTNQPFENSELARVGSLTQRFGTIDLKSASDSLSLNLMREFLPEEVFRLLCRFRSPTTTLPSGDEVDLHMISSMGNAFTFPLQTIFFSALVMAAYKVYGIRPKHFRGRSSGTSNFAVFGDDIIVDSRVYNLVCRLLEITGFIVNHDKSFNEGLFRESCGSDYLSGHEVRGVYLEALSDRYDIYSAINRLNRWSARHRVPLNCLVSFLTGMVRFIPVPYDEDDTSGIKVPYSMLSFHPRDDNGNPVYRRFVMKQRRFKVSDSEGALASSLGYFLNPEGLLVSFVGGYIRDGYIGLRSNARHATLRRRSTPKWDWMPVEKDIDRDLLPCYMPGRGESLAYRNSWKSVTPENLR